MKIFSKLDIKHSIFEVCVYGLPPAEARRLKSAIDEEIEAIMKTFAEEGRSFDCERRMVKVNGVEDVLRIRCEGY